MGYLLAFEEKTDATSTVRGDCRMSTENIRHGVDTTSRNAVLLHADSGQKGGVYA